MRVYGLFWPARTSVPTPASEAAIRANKDWLNWAVKTIPPDHREYGWKRAYAKKLEPELNKAAKANPALKPLKWESIVARLGELGWPARKKLTTD